MYDKKYYRIATTMQSYKPDYNKMRSQRNIILKRVKKKTVANGKI